MNQGDQVRQTKNQIISYKTKCIDIAQLSASITIANKQQIKTVKIMHSERECLSSVRGIEMFPNLQMLNLKNNSIDSIGGIGRLSNLRDLDLSSNQLGSLKGLEGCIRLEKLVLSNNKIQNIGELGTCVNLVHVDLVNNQITDERQLKVFSKLKKLQELWLEKKSATNPICQRNKQKYLQLLNNFVLCECKAIQKVDGQSPSQIIRNLSTKNVNIPQEHSHQEQNSNFSNSKDHQFQEFSHHNNTATRYDNEVDRYLAKKQTAKKRSLQYEAILGHKEEIIEELKMKIQQLEVTNAQQYKELVKKEAQNERIYGQFSQLARQIQSKDSKLTESQRRTEKLLEVIAESNKSIQQKNTAIQQLNKTINDLKIENAEYRALSKDYEKRMSELHNKAYSVAEERAVRGQQLKRHNKELYEQNINLSNDVNSLKERVRQLTQLLREWQYKYETRLREIKTEYESAQQEVEKDCEARLQSLTQQHNTQIKQMDEEMRQKLVSMEEEYQTALEETIAKYKALRNENEEKSHQESQLRAALRHMQGKSKDSQQMAQQMENALRRVRGEYDNLLRQRERLTKEYHSLKIGKDDENRRIRDELSKMSYQRNTQDKIIANLKENNHQLQGDLERLTAKQKEWEEKEEQYEDLQTKIKSQQAMLEDKNQTIQELKSQLQNLKQKEETEINESEKKFEQLRKKYDNLKHRIVEMEANAKQLLEQNDILKERQNEMEGREKELQKIESQLEEFSKIIEAQGKEIEQKEKRQEELLGFIQDIRNQEANRLKEMDQMRREVDRSQIQISEKQRKWRREKAELQKQFAQKIAKLEQQNENNKNTMKKKLQLFAKQMGM